MFSVCCVLLFVFVCLCVCACACMCVYVCIQYMYCGVGFRLCVLKLGRWCSLSTVCFLCVFVCLFVCLFVCACVCVCVRLRVHTVCVHVLHTCKLSIGYIPRCRTLHDLHNQGLKAPRLCKSRSVLHRGM